MLGFGFQRFPHATREVKVKLWADFGHPLLMTKNWTENRTVQIWTSGCFYFKKNSQG